MATSKEYMDFILDQLSLLEGITFRKMMGEYIRASRKTRLYRFFRDAGEF